jgi:hypothetical protein
MADDLGIPPAPDLSDLKPVKNLEPVENTFESLFEEV